MTCLWFDHFEAFFKGLIRQSKCVLSCLNDPIPYFCPGLVEISASGTNPHGAIYCTGVHTPLPSSLTFLDFFLFDILSGLRSFALWILWALAFVSLLLRPPVLSCWLIERGAVGRGGDGFGQPSGLEGSRRGRLHDLLTNFADLQLQAHLGGESVWVACLEGSGGLSWRGERSKKKDEKSDVMEIKSAISSVCCHLIESQISSCSEMPFKYSFPLSSTTLFGSVTYNLER